MNENHYLVPEQTQGISKDMEHTITIETVDDAEDWFVIAKNKLLDVNAWHKISTTPSAIFLLTDSHGKPLRRKAHRGDHIRISEQGNGPGHEWGIVNAIEYDDYPDEDMETMALHVRPTHHINATQHNEYDHNATDDSASSTLVVERRGRELSVLYHGRNGTHADAALEETTTLLPDMQWSGLIDGMLTLNP